VKRETGGPQPVKDIAASRVIPVNGAIRYLRDDAGKGVAARRTLPFAIRRPRLPVSRLA
jgi:hypothetical protein